MDANSGDAGRRCQWCSEPAAETDTHCRACGANLAQRDALGEVVIPGVTHVDPGLKAYANHPLRIPGASPSQRVAPDLIGAAAIAGGPAGLIALAGLGAVAASEFAGAGRGHGMTQAQLEKLGQPSEAALQMLRKLDEKYAPPPEGDPVARADASSQTPGPHQRGAEQPGAHDPRADHPGADQPGAHPPNPNRPTIL
jgi:hypothetical protein